MLNINSQNEYRIKKEGNSSIVLAQKPLEDNNAKSSNSILSLNGNEYDSRTFDHYLNLVPREKRDFTDAHSPRLNVKREIDNNSPRILWIKANEGGTLHGRINREMELT